MTEERLLTVLLGPRVQYIIMATLN